MDPENGTEVPSSEWQQTNTGSDNATADTQKAANDDSNSFGNGRNGGETLYEVTIN